MTALRKPGEAPPPPWTPPRWDPVDAHAIRAVAHGEATADQQRHAMRWIIESAAATYQDTHFPEDADRCFANGRRFVGLRLVALINMPAAALAEHGDRNVRNEH